VRVNQTKAKLKAGETVYGCFTRYPDASLVEVLGYQGFDFLLFDAEHGTIEPKDCEHMVRAAELRCVTPMVRVTTNFPPIILRYMDTGAQGLHIPWVNTAEEAEQAVRSVKYSPRGIRGLASVRAADYGQVAPFSEYVAQANAETLVVVHVETVEAIESLPEMLKIEGLDVIFVGATDLSHSMGLPGQVEHVSVQAAIQHIVDAVHGSDRVLGALVGSGEAARRWRERGARYIATTTEALLAQASRGYLKSLKEN
jgi:4-hydroxy-2-oxoheptanedioate aldolase